MILALSAEEARWAAGLAVALYALLALAGPRLGSGMARLVFALAWLLHGVTLAEGLLGQPPRFGFAPALSMTVWLVLAVAALETYLMPQLKPRWPLAGLSAVSLLAALVWPGSTYPTIASPWLPLHWALGMASYGLFAAAVLHGWLMSRTERLMRSASGLDGAGVPLLTLERLTFRFVEAGFVLLTATLLAGWWFAETLYGPAMKSLWNHKTIFSLLAWLTFAGLLIGRAQLGWRGRQALRVLYFGSGLLLLGYTGSRFVFEVVLHRA